MSKHLKLVEAAEYLNVPVNTLRYWLSRNQAPASFKMGRSRFFALEDLDAFIEREKAKSGSAA